MKRSEKTLSKLHKLALVVLVVVACGENPFGDKSKIVQAGDGVTVSDPALLTINSPTQWSDTDYQSTADVTFTITNTSDETAATGVTFSGLATPFSELSTSCTSAISAGESCAYTIRFTSPGVGAFGDTLLLDYYEHGSSPAAQVAKSLTANGRARSATVTEVYDTSSDGMGQAKWNDYVRTANTAALCDGSESGYLRSICIHSGEKLQIALTGTSSCSGLTLAETLGVFQWSCDATSGTATFYSNGFNAGKGLGHLLDVASWKDNSITVSKGGYTIYSSALTTWHSNTVAAAAVNSGGGDSMVTLAGASNIFTVSAASGNNVSQGYKFGADKQALVILPNETLTYGGIATGCSGSRCLVFGNGRLFAWLEGEFNGVPAAGTTAYYTVSTGAMKFSRFHNLSVIGDTTATYTSVFSNTNTNQNYFDNIRINKSNNTGVYFSGSSYNEVNNLTVSEVNSGLYLTGSTYNKFYTASLFESRTGDGVSLRSASDNNILSDVMVAGAGTFGINFESSNNNILTKATVISTQNSGIFFMNTAANNTVLFATVINSNNSGIHFRQSTVGNLVSSAFLANNGGAGFKFADATSANIISNVVATNNHTNISLEGSTTANVFSNNLIVGAPVGGANCYNASVGANPGLANSTCANQGSSNAVLRTGATSASSIKGPVTSDSNTSDINGVQDYSLITDWITFDNRYRGWGNTDAAAWPTTNYYARCAAGNCQIFDARYLATDNATRNKSFDGNNANDPFTDGGPCPNAVNGNFALTDNQTPANTFMVNALEVIGDEVGNDNGLCETAENCIYQPNFGSYLGDGDYSTQRCTPSGGALVPALIYAYPVNGA